MPISDCQLTAIDERFKFHQTLIGNRHLAIENP